MPSHHGPWDNFSATVRRDTPDEQAILGPVSFRGRKPLRGEERGESMLPDSCDSEGKAAECGVGEAADMIMLNPIFNTHESAGSSPTT